MKNKGIRITSLLLKNYAPFYESMGTKLFEFDRTKSNNKLVLILGANGAGKSFLMTELTPEPLEHIAGRTSNRYLEGEEGKKEITFVVSNSDNIDVDKYKCTIIYSADRRKTTCYFTHTNLLTGEEKELNPNGNVSSYMEACKLYLGYDKNYKNIGYLSDDVKNVVNMSFNERQQLISNWLPNTSEFLQAAKIAQKKRNQTQKEIDNLLKDIAKISTGDIEIQLKQEEDKLIIEKAKQEKIKDGLSKSNLMLSMLGKYDRQSLNVKKIEYINKVKEYNNSYSKNIEMLKKYNKYLKNDSGKEQLSTDIIKLNAEEEKLINEESSTNDEIIRLTSQIESMNVQDDPNSGKYDLISINKSLDMNKMDLDNVIKFIDNTLKDHEDYSEFTVYKSELKIATSATISALMNIALISTKISSMCGNYEFKQIFDSKIGEDIESEIDNLKNTNELLNKQISDLETKLRESEAHSVDFGSLRQYIPTGCNENKCSLIKRLIAIARDNSSNVMILTKNKIDEIKNKIIENQKHIEERQLVKQNLKNALYDMGQVADILKTLDDKTYNLPKSLRDEINSPIAYNVLLKNSLLLEEIKSFDEYVSLLEKKTALEQSISSLQNISNILSLSEENKRILQANIDRRKELTHKVKNITTKKNNIIEEKNTLSSLKDKITALHEEKTSLLEINKELTTIKSNLIIENKYVYCKNQISVALRKLRELDFNVNKSVIELQNKIERYKTQLTSVDVLVNRKKNLEEKRDLYNLTYDIWSAEGYPSLLINDFLDEVTECTNKDLDSSWGGMLNVDKFKLDSTALKIPINRGNSKLEDVSECSKAERATIDLAISFGILEVSTADKLYNIIKIDEKDGPMDSVRKQTFLDVLLDRMSNINCKNAFCITHSNCFENVEADVILLKGYENVISENSLINKNIIFRYDKTI